MIAVEFFDEYKVDDKMIAVKMVFVVFLRARTH